MLPSKQHTLIRKNCTTQDIHNIKTTTVLEIIKKQVQLVSWTVEERKYAIDAEATNIYSANKKAFASFLALGFDETATYEETAVSN